MAIPTFTQTQLEAAKPEGPTALTIGVLDGVHRGHQYLLGELAREAESRGLSPGVVTLHPHPITVLRPETPPSYLSSLQERITRMQAAGAEWVVPLIFTADISELTGEELADAFVEHLGMRLMVLGPDAAFGRGAPKDTVERMRTHGEKMGFEVVQVESLMHDHERYSSTAVRNALSAGEMERVTDLLGRPYGLTGPVVEGFQRGRTIGFATANISVAADRALPALGVYATRVYLGERVLKGATNIGRRPTFDRGHVSIETHILDFDEDIYGHRLTIEIIEGVRGEVEFDGVEALTAQIAKDVTQVREVLA